MVMFVYKEVQIMRGGLRSGMIANGTLSVMIIGVGLMHE